MTPETEQLSCADCRKPIIRTPNGGATCLFGHVAPVDTLNCDAAFVVPAPTAAVPPELADRIAAGYLTGWTDRSAPRPWALSITTSHIYGHQFAEGYGRGWAAASLQLAKRAAGSVVPDVGC